jgi:hypothetical protein
MNIYCPHWQIALVNQFGGFSGVHSSCGLERSRVPTATDQEYAELQVEGR